MTSPAAVGRESAGAATPRAMRSAMSVIWAPPLLLMVLLLVSRLLAPPRVRPMEATPEFTGA